MKRTIYTLNVGNYSPEICAMTYPLLKEYAHKIGADFAVIEKPYDLGEGGAACKISGKFHLYKLAQAADTWSIFLDSDALVHPDAFDYSACLDPIDEHGRPSVFSFGRDFAYERFNPAMLNKWEDKSKPKEFPQTAREAIGMCTWFIIVSNLSRMLWEPPVSLMCTSNIFPTHDERHIKTPLSLLDDFMTSFNAARYNLSVTTAAQIHQIAADTPIRQKMSFWHTHLLSERQKVEQIHHQITKVWRLRDTPAMVFARHDRAFAALKASGKPAKKDRKNK